MRFILVVFIIFLSSCTYSVTLAHTSGTASDLIDEEQTATPSTSVSLPVSLVK